ncbi:hypothetical protein IV59_GL000318 [Paucilactobacillus hokkaidonensis]|nr:hypothetical protein IV59_GL000318 [Paucilactobacillus hokkaidonensis]
MLNMDSLKNNHEKKRIQVAVDKNVAKEAETIMSEVGTNPTNLINMLYRAVISEGGIPFQAKLSKMQRAELTIQNYADSQKTIHITSADQLAKIWADEDDE